MQTNKSLKTVVPADPVDDLAREFHAMMMNFNKFKQQLGATPIDRVAVTVLGVLSDCGPSRLTRVAEVTGLDVSTVSRQVSDLEKAGYLTRMADPDDGRATLLQATDAGTSLMKKVQAGSRRRLQRLVSDWSERDITAFANLLGRFTTAQVKYADVNREELEQELKNG